MNGLLGWLPIAVSVVSLLIGIVQFAKGRSFGKWIALGSGLFLIANILMNVGEPQIEHFVHGERARTIGKVILETFYFGVSGIGMLLMFLAVVAQRPAEDTHRDPEEQFVKLAKIAWGLYKHSRQRRR